jgi:hypothetical protein
MGSQAGRGQGNITIFATFPLTDMQQLAFPIDIFHLQTHPFQQAQPAGIDRGQADPVVWAMYLRQLPPG